MCNGNNYVFILETTDGRSRHQEGDGAARGTDYKQNTINRRGGRRHEALRATIVDEGAKSVGDGQEVKVTNL